VLNGETVAYRDASYALSARPPFHPGLPLLQDFLLTGCAGGI
jgi:hypothetical protein